MRSTGLLPALLILGAATTLGLYAGDASAQWKWRDANGRITVSDTPPPRGVPDRDILQRPAAAPAAAPVSPVSTVAPDAEAASAAAAASAPAAPTAPARVDPELEKRRQAAEQEQAAKKKAAEAELAAKRAENCRAARSHLSLLESGQRMVRINDKGERVIVDDAHRAAETQRARAVITSDCR